MKETVSDATIYRRALNAAAARTVTIDNDETMARFIRRAGLDAIMAFEDEVDKVRKSDTSLLRKALTEARDKFAFYAEQHRAKGSAESITKAMVNEQMVAMIAHTLGDK